MWLRGCTQTDEILMRSMQLSGERLKRSREVMVSVEARQYYELRRNVGSCGGGAPAVFRSGGGGQVEADVMRGAPIGQISTRV